MTKELKWGTYGKGGIEHCLGTCPEHQLRWVPLAECDTEHLQTILRNQRHVYDRPMYLQAIHAILAERGVKPKEFSYKAEQEMYEAMRQAQRRIDNGPNT